MSEPIELISKGLELESQSKYYEAEQYILRGIKEYEKRNDLDGVTFALGRLGDCYEQTGQVEKAQEAYEKAIQIGTDIPATYHGLISILIFTSQFDQAFKVAEIWQQKGNQYSSSPTQEVFIDLSSRLIREKRFEEAVQLLNRTIAYFPRQQFSQTYWLIRGLIGNAYEKEGNLEEAMQLYAKAISEGCKDSFTFNRYLINLEKQKQYQQALVIVKKALKIKKEAAWETDLRKRKQRLEQKTGAVPKGTPKELIPDFAIRAGKQNLSLIKQIQFSPQLSSLVCSGNHFFGTTGGKTSKLFCYQIGEDVRIWETPLEEEPAGLLAINDRVVAYTRKGRIGEGETNLFFYDTTNGKLLNRQRLPDVPSEVVAAGDHIYAGCRDGQLYAFSIEGQRLWSYRLTGSTDPQESNYSRPCPYYIAAGNDLVAFTSFGTLYVLKPQGKLLYKWEMPEHSETSKTKYLTITISTGAPSAVALSVAPTGKNVLIASNNTVYELINGKEVQKSRNKFDSINRVYWIAPSVWGICDTKKFVMVENGKLSTKIPLKDYSQLVFNRLGNRLVIWSRNNLSVATISGKLLSNIEFARRIHSVTCFDNGQILIGTRYAILFDSNPESPKTKQSDPTQQETTSLEEKPDLPTKITKQLPTEENGIPLQWIEAQKLTIGPGKAFYKASTGEELTIEQLVLNYSISRGLRGAWTENGYWWQIMALLFWNVIFEKLPGVYTPQFGAFPSKMQDMPLDFFHPEFYTRRKHMIERRIQEFGSARLFGLVRVNLETELRSAYHRYYGMPCRPIEDWQRFTIDELLIATQALQKKQLLLIMQRLLENFNENRRGLPDLFLVKPNGKALFVEVKSEKEKVADHQITWHHFLKNHVQIPVVIFRVINI